MYSKGRVLGFERAKRTQNPNVSLIKLEGVQTTKDAQFYLGKRVAYVYRAKREINGSKIRVIWGRISRAHGTSGVVKARFRKNLPAKTMGASVRVVSISTIVSCTEMETKKRYKYKKCNLILIKSLFKYK